VISNDVADEYDLFSNEVDANYADEISTLDITDYLTLTTNDQLHILMDKLNLLLAQGRVSDQSLDVIISVLKEFPNTTDAEKSDKVKLAIYLIMTAPEYLINR
jgi:hypothetical protein